MRVVSLILRAAFVLASAWVLIVCLAWIFQRKLIYFPMGGELPRAGAVLRGGEDVVFETQDGIRLAGWFVRGRPQGPRREKPRRRAKVEAPREEGRGTGQAGRGEAEEGAPKGKSEWT